MSLSHLNRPRQKRACLARICGCALLTNGAKSNKIHRRHIVFLTELYLQELYKLRKGQRDTKYRDLWSPKLLQSGSRLRKFYLQTWATFQGKGKIIFKVEPSVQRVKQKKPWRKYSMALNSKEGLPTYALQDFRISVDLCAFHFGTHWIREFTGYPTPVPPLCVGCVGSNFVALVSWHSSWENCIQGLFWRNHTWGASFIPGSDLYDEILDSEVTLSKDENF